MEPIGFFFNLSSSQNAIYSSKNATQPLVCRGYFNFMATTPSWGISFPRVTAFSKNLKKDTFLVIHNTQDYKMREKRSYIFSEILCTVDERWAVKNSISTYVWHNFDVFFWLQWILLKIMYHFNVFQGWMSVEFFYPLYFRNEFLKMESL